MLQEKDPIAIGLFEAFNRVPMPNLRLNEHEVDSLLSYIETESRRVEKVQKVEALKRQKGVELPEDCCQKADMMVIENEPELVQAESVSQQDQESTPACCAEPADCCDELEPVVASVEPAAAQLAVAAPTTSPYSMAIWLCGLGLGLIAFKLREKGQ
jgi:hypothetical protein